jgi:formiminotetrahydrofolate cyclodeaminase
MASIRRPADGAATKSMPGSDAMTESMLETTLERFREAAASGLPTPAGVAVAAVSASFAFGLLAKALAVSGRKKASSAAVARLAPLEAAARAESSRLLRLAAADVAAFEAYLRGARLPQSTDRERRERRQALDCALREAIEVPLAAARSAATGLQGCADSVSLTQLPVLADVATAITLLCGALRAFLVCAESNVRQLAPETSPYRDRLAAEGDAATRALGQAEESLGLITAALDAARPAREP